MYVCECGLLSSWNVTRRHDRCRRSIETSRTTLVAAQRGTLTWSSPSTSGRWCSSWNPWWFLFPSLPVSKEERVCVREQSSWYAIETRSSWHVKLSFRRRRNNPCRRPKAWPWPWTTVNQQDKTQRQDKQTKLTFGLGKLDLSSVQHQVGVLGHLWESIGRQHG